MKHRALCMAGFTALVMVGCASGNAARPGGDYSAVTKATAYLHDAAGHDVGSAQIIQIGNKVRLIVRATNLPSGMHGVHIHEIGICLSPDFASAGVHWNPANRQHGKDNPAGMHRGDLPNIVIGADGRGTLQYTIQTARLSGDDFSIMDKDGAALVVHAVADDYRTNPSGNSGGRIACGVLR